jgi:hypothetical protein
LPLALSAGIAVIAIVGLGQREILLWLGNAVDLPADRLQDDAGDLFRLTAWAWVVVLTWAATADRWATDGRGAPTSLLFHAVSRPVRRFRTLALAATGVAVLLCGLFVAAGALGISDWFAEDGPVEWATAIGFMAAAAMLAMAVLRPGEHLQARGPLRFLMGLGALAFAFVALEEVSYGQRVLGFTTPDAFAERNDQGEFNLHNLDNRLMLALYAPVGIAVFAVTAANAWFWARWTAGRRWFAQALPDPSLLPLAGIILIFSQHVQFHELVEPLAALFALLFAVRPHDAVPEAASAP